MSEKPRPNLLDVARHAGVSPATVSRVLNHTAPVRASIRERVLASVNLLRYEPLATRAVSPSAISTIALVLPDILNPFFTEIVRGVQDQAEVDRFMLLLFDTGEDPNRERQALQMLLHRSVSGIIVCASRLPSPELIAIRARQKIPMVVVNRKIDDPEMPCILLDFETGAYRAARHLLDLHHTRIGYFKGPVTSEPSLARRRGVEKALGEAGLVLRPECCPASFPNVDGGFQAMSTLLALPPTDRPTAVIAYNDMMALGALHATRAHHLRVPEDISIVGFDDIAMAAHTNPPLTTVSQPKHRMGQLAMKILGGLIRGQTFLGDGYTMLESSLVVRESTGPAPSASGCGGAA
ncbi:MAG: LacI family DNA-binding transcriptional regulator [Chloroflexi bacterium]|nr:LacI family DNA-binding transcriptional regulator [Chloroflexota bacterium]